MEMPTMQRCLQRLLQIAQRDRGGSRHAASVLLSLWDGDQFKCDLQALLCLDGHLLGQGSESLLDVGSN
jgi:hypothetical protein